MNGFLKTLPVLSLALAMVSCGGESGHVGAGVRLGTLELDVSFPVSFSYLSGVRELSDGRILAADPISQVLLRLDLTAGTADTIGRQGSGPQEYEGPDRVFPLPGDSTLLVDLGNGRLTKIDSEGEFVEWIPMNTSVGPRVTRTVNPSFVDSAGNLYATAPYFLRGPADSTLIHKIDRAHGGETPVANTWHTERVRRPRATKRPMLVLSDDWAVSSDGRVAVVRANGYSVDWYLPDGTVTRGPTHEATTYPVGMPEMEAELEKMMSTRIFTRALVGEDGSQSLQMARGVPAGVLPGIDSLDWPEMLPIFRGGGTLVSPGGEVWVERFLPEGTAVRMDVFDERGILLGFVELPLKAKIIGFAAGEAVGSMVYVARTDDVGLVWLERYRVVREGDRR